MFFFSRCVSLFVPGTQARLLRFLRSHLVQQSWRLLILGARCRVWLFSLAFPDVVSVGWSEGRQSSGTAGFWCSVSVAGGRTATAAQSTMLICMFALNFKGQPFFFSSPVCILNWSIEKMKHNLKQSLFLLFCQGLGGKEQQTAQGGVWIPVLFGNLSSTKQYLLLAGGTADVQLHYLANALPRGISSKN